MSITTFDPTKFENVQQVGGIRTGSLDYPNPNGGQSCRVAWINTGTGLRFTLALDRGGDVVEASYNHLNLAYLTPNDYKPPSHAYHQGLHWLSGWPGGLVTTAGPELMGAPRTDGDTVVSLHGRFSSTPAAVLEVVNPDPQRGQLDLRLVLLIRDTRMFGPNIEVRREIRSRLGESWFTISDQVTNRGDEPCRHALLYHVNFGYPLLDEGTRLLYQGRGVLHDQRGEYATPSTAEQIKQAPAPGEAYRGTREQLVIAEPISEPDGTTRVGILNERQQLGMSLTYSANALPRLASWLHYGPRGSYVASLEPFFGSILGQDNDNHPSATATLEPGETKQYEVTYRVCSTAAELGQLASLDGPLELST